MAPSSKQQIEAPADEFELSVENLRKWLLTPFEKARQPIIEAKKQMQDDGVSDQLIAQNLSFEKGVRERNRAETIKLTTNPKTGKLWDLDTLEAAGMVSEAERENIIRAHNGREPPYMYVSQLHRIYDDRANPPKSYLTANCMFEGLCVGKRAAFVVNPEPNRRINTSFTLGIEHSVPLEWNTMKDPYDRNNTDEEKKVATFNSVNWMEGDNSPKIYTIPFSRDIAEKLLARGKDGLPSLSVKNLSNRRTYGVKSVQDFCTDDIAGLVESLEKPKPTYSFNLDGAKLAEFMKFQKAKEETGEDHFQ